MPVPLSAPIVTNPPSSERPLADRTLALDEPFGGRYRIERELGHGGMATVYLARDLKHEGRLVAVKVLRPEIAALLGRDRFLQEIDLIARLNHPHILTLHDSDETRPRGSGDQGFLYYVMQYVEGGSLQDRLTATPRLPVDEALALVLQVADALAYAHVQGVVHRDIKPGNILLAGDHAYVADFGIARAIRQVLTGEQSTESGLVVGSPPYMAPEQFQSSSKVDGRADEYALACVLYECLMGSTPDPGKAEGGPLVWTLRRERPDIPPYVDAALRKALATSRHERFATIEEFAAQLRRPPRPSAQTATRRMQLWRWAALALFLIVVAGIVKQLTGWFDGGAPVELDSTRYAVLPFEYGPGTGSGQESEQLRSALRRWQGVAIADRVRVREAVQRLGNGRLTGPDAVRIARAVGTGRYLRGTVSREGDSLRIAGALYGVAHGRDSLLAEHTQSVALGAASGSEAWEQLVDHLLLRGAIPPGGFPALGTRSLPAWQAFANGQQSLGEWRLAQAESTFSAAARYDGDFARANLWLGLVRLWNGEDPARWQHAAEAANAGAARLTPVERPMAEALLSSGRGDLVKACQQWRDVATAAPGEFAAWYGWAHCLRSDDAVLRDRRSPSGWRFRTSYGEALRAYQRAFVLRPAVLSSFRAESYQSIRTLLHTSVDNSRAGFADSTLFVAYAGWYHDTLGFVPYPLREFQALRPGATVARAAEEQRRVFRQIALAWVTAAPNSADALEALGISLEMLGDPSAIDTLRRARSLARGPAEGIRVGGSEAWALVRFSVPGAPEQLRQARALADSLLQRNPGDPLTAPGLLASLAALTGRAGLTARYARTAAVLEGRNLPRPLLDLMPALLAFAALGGPADSIALLERQVLAMVDRDLTEADRARALDQWVGRAAVLAFADHRPASLSRLADRGSLLVEAQLAWSRGQRDSARAVLAHLQQIRAGIPPASFTLDALYPEARLLLELGDTAAAREWMRPTLGAIRFTAPEVLADPWRAASLVRAMALQAELDQDAGNHDEARQWARAAVILWSDADPFLQPEVQRLRQIGS